MMIQDFVFGYGSLICPRNRAKTVPEHAHKVVTPVVVKGVQRTWSKRVSSSVVMSSSTSSNSSSASPASVRGKSSLAPQQRKRQIKMTAMGISFVHDAECVGVLLPVDGKELKEFDKREGGYDRVTLNLDDVHLIEFPDTEKDKNVLVHDSCPFLLAKRQQRARSLNHGESHDDKTNQSGDANAWGHDNDDDMDPATMIRIWVYVQRELQLPNADHPIVQSYVDVILGGCLSISEEFARDFIIHTKGWSPKQVEHRAVGDKKTSPTSSSSGGMAVWVDDRHDPIYARAEREWSLKMADQLDRLLRLHRPHNFHQRLSLAPSIRQS